MLENEKIVKIKTVKHEGKRPDTNRHMPSIAFMALTLII